jgi:hypothetical protein
VQQGLAEVTVLDLEGAVVPLASLWQEGPAVITFLRHYG